MRLRLFWVGKTKERYLADGVREYLRKLRPFADVEVVEIKEEKDGPVDAAMRKEGERILKKASGFALLDVAGRSLDSVRFASYIAERPEVDFVLGGAYGVSPDVRAAARDTISLSQMTLTHEMARLVLLEQLYRAAMINAGRGYHH